MCAYIERSVGTCSDGDLSNVLPDSLESDEGVNMSRPDKEKTKGSTGGKARRRAVAEASRQPWECPAVSVPSSFARFIGQVCIFRN